MLNALTLCNSCEEREAMPGNAAGYCAKCDADARIDPRGWRVINAYGDTLRGHLSETQARVAKKFFKCAGYTGVRIVGTLLPGA